MWLIVGLGNPGSKYTKTRHNLGFFVLEEFTGKHALKFNERKDYKICSGSIENSEIILLGPLTFMNKSGTAVKKISEKFTIIPHNIIVIHDDLDLETGRLKISKKGSSGGHKGIESIINNLGSNEFLRIKIGIGRDISIPAEDYVLSKFNKDEIPLIKEAVKKASDSIDCIVKEGVEKAMNRFN